MSTLDVRVISWPEDAGYGKALPFEDLQRADILGDRRTDFVVRRGQSVYLMARPNVWSAHIQVGRAIDDSYDGLVARDFAIVPGYGPGGQDAIAVSAGPEDPEGGLVLAWLPPAGDSFEAQFVPSASWRDVQHIVAADFTGDGLTDVGMVDSAGQHFEVMEQGPNNTWSTHDIWSLPAPVSDVRALQYVPKTSEYELAFTSTLGLLIFEADGDLLLRLRSILGNDAMCVIEEPSGAEGVIYVTGHPNGMDQSMLWVHPGGIWDSPVTLSGGVAGLDSGDLDGDSDSDLLVSWKSTSDLTAFENHAIDPPTMQPPTVRFSTAPGAFEVHPTEESAVYDPNASLAPLIVDLDGDDIPAAAIQIASEEATYLLDDELLPAWEVPSGFADLDFGVGACLEYTWGLVDSVLQLEILNSQNPTYDHVEVILWSQGDGVVPTNPNGMYTNPIAESHCYYDLDLLWSGPGQTGCQYLQFELPGVIAGTSAESEFLQIYYADVFLFDSSGAYVNGRSAVAVFSMDENAILQVQEFGLWVPHIFESDVDAGSGALGGGIDGNPLGGFVRGKRVPRFPPGSVPRPGNKCPAGHGGNTAP